MPWVKSPRRTGSWPCLSPGDQVWTAARCRGVFRPHLTPVTQWPNPAWFQAPGAASYCGHPPPGRAQLGAVLPWVQSAGSRRWPGTARGPASTHTPGITNKRPPQRQRAQQRPPQPRGPNSRFSRPSATRRTDSQGEALGGSCGGTGSTAKRRQRTQGRLCPTHCNNSAATLRRTFQEAMSP